MVTNSFSKRVQNDIKYRITSDKTVSHNFLLFLSPAKSMVLSEDQLWNYGPDDGIRQKVQFAMSPPSSQSAYLQGTPPTSSYNYYSNSGEPAYPIHLSQAAPPFPLPVGHSMYSSPNYPNYQALQFGSQASSGTLPLGAGGMPNNVQKSHTVIQSSVIRPVPVGNNG